MKLSTKVKSNTETFYCNWGKNREHRVGIIKKQHTYTKSGKYTVNSRKTYKVS